MKAARRDGDDRTPIDQQGRNAMTQTCADVHYSVSERHQGGVATQGFLADLGRESLPHLPETRAWADRWGVADACVGDLLISAETYGDAWQAALRCDFGDEDGDYRSECRDNFPWWEVDAWVRIAGGGDVEVAAAESRDFDRADALLGDAVTAYRQADVAMYLARKGLHEAIRLAHREGVSAYRIAQVTRLAERHVGRIVRGEQGRTRND